MRKRTGHHLFAKVGRTGFIVLGCVMLALGIIGAFVPVMPTTIFIILAAWCFARSSPRLEAWLLNHPRFGPGLRRWREEGAVPRQAKLMACIGITVGYIVFFIGARPGPLLAVAVALFMLGSAIYVVSRPAPASENNGDGVQTDDIQSPPPTAPTQHESTTTTKIDHHSL